jgi:hypothetical protein
MLGFDFKLVQADGTPADPPTLKAAVPNWGPGDTIHLPGERSLRVIETRISEGTDGEPVSVLVFPPESDNRPRWGCRRIEALFTECVGHKPTTRLEALLDELCATYGYCLPSDQEAAILADPPQDLDLDAFVDAVLLADGDDPGLTDKRIRAELSDVVRDWLFDDDRGKGTKSGLPRFA